MDLGVHPLFLSVSAPARQPGNWVPTMDHRLLAWGRRRKTGLPALWLFTDSARLPDPLPAIARLPTGKAGVVFRHDSDPDRAVLGRAIAILCRRRRLPLVVAGDAPLAAALRAGVHLRGGRWPDSRRRGGIVTSSAHSLADIRRARLAGADLVFLSPVFPTRSHPGAPSLGPVRWVRMARSARIPVAALGGIDGRSARALPVRFCAGAGAITALA